MFLTEDMIEVQQTCTSIQIMGVTGVFLWVPAHTGLEDEAAKEATKKSVVDLLVSISKREIKNIIKQRLRSRWQKQ